jgi:hypothetical protein
MSRGIILRIMPTCADMGLGSCSREEPKMELKKLAAVLALTIGATGGVAAFSAPA